jgi:hypothetical protein
MKLVLSMNEAQEKQEPAASWVQPDELKPWARNPRHNEAAIAEVAKSIERYGFGAPVVARREDKRIIAGHTRVAAAKRLGLEKIPVRLLDISDADADMLSLADNKLGELAEWDVEELMALGGDGLDLMEVGWTELDLEELQLAETPGLSNFAGGVSPVKRKTMVTIVLNVDDVEEVELALDKAAGEEMGRGEALVKICRAFR